MNGSAYNVIDSRFVKTAINRCGFSVKDQHNCLNFTGSSLSEREVHMSPALVTVLKPKFYRKFLRPGERYTWGLHEFTATEDGFFVDSEMDNDDYSGSLPRKDFKYGDPRSSFEGHDWSGVVVRVRAIPMSDLPN